ncbi:hypothetical protein F511_47292 [Dorcoceras hygrometricum]|uniref:Chromo domain-containing protein n=1 Tax=Dorcoceras hygrometricum TaxID=472368 RepID=A0A2Z6ZXW8_9LAMI|nr:hypothetical protein F511_47292 [Dorcoceras hygrometricum]
MVNNICELWNECIEQYFDNNGSPEIEQRDCYKPLLGRKENLILHAINSTLTHILFGLVAPVTHGSSFEKSDDKEFKFIVVAVHWKGRTAEEDTWEDITAFTAQFPDFNLGDKVARKSGGIVMDQTTNDPNKRARSITTQVYYRRKKSGRLA